MNPAHRIEVRVTARSKRPGIEVGPEGVWNVRVAAPAAEGRANAAVIEAVAGRLGVPKSLIRICRGESSRNKVVEVLKRG